MEECIEVKGIESQVPLLVHLSDIVSVSESDGGNAVLEFESHNIEIEKSVMDFFADINACVRT